MNWVSHEGGWRYKNGIFVLSQDWPFANLSHLGIRTRVMSCCLLLFSCHQHHPFFVGRGDVPYNVSVFFEPEHSCHKKYLLLIYSNERDNVDSVLCCGGHGKDKVKLWSLCCTQWDQNCLKRFVTFGKHQQTCSDHNWSHRQTLNIVLWCS